MRKKLMGGGMMGRRMGYQSGMSVKGDNKRDIRKTESMTGASKSSKREKGKVPTTPKEKSLAKLAPPRDKITFGDVVAGRTKGKA